MPEPLKKYETLIEAAFVLVEAHLQGKARKEHLDNLITAFHTLKKFRVAGEPVFVLRGHDRLAPKAIEAWGCFVSSYSATQGPREHASYERDRMVAWQEKHPELVKMPD